MHQDGASIHTAYYISSLDADAAMFLRLTRGHWSIENQFHWLLDVSSKASVARQRRMAAHDNDFALSRLMFEQMTFPW